MNDSSFFLMTLLANKVSSNKSILACPIPSMSIASRATTFPLWMSFPIIKFGQPFSFALIITKCLVSVKATSRAGNIFSTPRTLPYKQVRPSLIWLAYLTLYSALNRAKQLTTLTSMRNILSALTAIVSRRLSPSSYPIAFQRTILGMRSAIERVIRFTADLTSICNSIYSPILATHTYIIPQKQIEERYAEIAAKRCSQSVMNFGAMK